MLRPAKVDHPERTIINLSLLLTRLYGRLFDEFDMLRQFAKDSVKGGDALFLP